MQKHLLSAAVLFAASALSAESHHDHHAHHQHHPTGVHSDAPIGVMGSHMHSAGEWMFSYRFMRMTMDGMLDGTDSVSTSALLQMGGDYNYMMVPTEMSMDMHMLGSMYGITDRLTIMGMINYIDNEMDMERRMGTPRTFSTSSSGLGDISLSLLYLFNQSEQQQWHGSIGLSLPTGSIDEEDDTPMGSNTHLPYNMQLGSGTFDLKPSITYLGTAKNMSWGAQIQSIIRLGENDNEYTLGNRNNLTLWYAYNKIPTATATVRLNYNDWGKIDGDDKELSMSPMMNPNADPDLRGGQRLDLGLGLNSSHGKHRFSIELLFPILQDLDGPQMETTLSTVLGYQLYLH